MKLCQHSGRGHYVLIFRSKAKGTEGQLKRIDYEMEGAVKCDFEALVRGDNKYDTVAFGPDGEIIAEGGDCFDIIGAYAVHRQEAAH